MEKIEFEVNDFEVIGKDIANNQKVVRPSISFWKDTFRRFKTNKLAMFGFFMLIVVIFMALFGQYFTKYQPDAQYLDKTLLPPGSDGHIFGTDSLGRDLFARIWQGARVSLLVGIFFAIADIVIGSLIGGISGYFGGRVDNILMRIVDVLIAIPYMLIVILCTIVFGRGIFTIVAAMTVTGWCGTARLVRGQVLQLKEQEFVMAAQVLGASPLRIIVKHLIPNVIGVLIVTLTLDVPGAIFSEGFLSFLGLGVQIPKASLGSLIADGYSYILSQPYLLFVPVIVLCIMMLAFNFMAEGLTDALDPKMRK